jgi:hypothetical protein
MALTGNGKIGAAQQRIVAVFQGGFRKFTIIRVARTRAYWEVIACCAVIF